MELKNFGELNYIKEDDKLGYLLEGMALASEQVDLLNKKKPSKKDEKRIEEIFRREEEIVILVEFLEGNLVDKEDKCHDKVTIFPYVEINEIDDSIKLSETITYNKGDRVELIKKSHQLCDSVKVGDKGTIDYLHTRGVYNVKFDSGLEQLVPIVLLKKITRGRKPKNEKRA